MPLGLIGEEHGIAVEGNPDLLPRISQCPGGRVDQARGDPCAQGLGNVGRRGGQEQIHIKCTQVGGSRRASCQNGPLDVELVVLDRAPQAQAGRRVVLGNNHHLGPPRPGSWRESPRSFIEPEDRLDQREPASRLEQLLDMLELVTGVGIHPFGLVNPVGLFEVEQGA